MDLSSNRRGCEVQHRVLSLTIYYRLEEGLRIYNQIGIWRYAVVLSRAQSQLGIFVAPTNPFSSLLEVYNQNGYTSKNSTVAEPFISLQTFCTSTTKKDFENLCTSIDANYFVSEHYVVFLAQKDNKYA